MFGQAQRWFGIGGDSSDKESEAEYVLLQRDPEGGNGAGDAAGSEVSRGRKAENRVAQIASDLVSAFASLHFNLRALLLIGFGLLALFSAILIFKRRHLHEPSLYPTDRSYLNYTFTPSTTPFPDIDPHGQNVEQHNAAILERIDRCRSLGLLQNTSLPIPVHLRLSDADEARYAAEGCGTNETTIILVEDAFWKATFWGSKTGESIWALSTMRALAAYGYPYVLTSDGYLWHSVKGTKEVWAKYKDNVRVVIMHQTGMWTCMNEDKECVQSAENPEGIPDWKILTWWWWDEPQHSLGPRFTLSPAKHTGNRFVPYSIEPACSSLPFTPTSERLDRIYLLAKEVRYFATEKYDFAWDLPGMTDIASAEGITFVGGFKVGDEHQEEREKLMQEVLDAGVQNLGTLGREAFYQELSKSRALMGLSFPKLSPSPWDGLCMGLPFINPITEWDPEDKWDRSKWQLQQQRMADLGPPYVYPVHAHDLAALHDAIAQALAHPIDRFIPEYMRFDHVVEQVMEILEWDWQEEARIARAELGL